MTSKLSFNTSNFLLSYNVRSLNGNLFSSNISINNFTITSPLNLFSSNKLKLKAIQQYVSQLNPGIVCLNETWLNSKDKELYFQYYNVFESRMLSSTSRKAGVALLVHKDIEMIENKIFVEGRAVYAKIKFQSREMNVIAVYSPNSPRERADFWKKIASFLPRNQQTIIFGDFNQVENTNVDRIPSGTKLASSEISSIQNLFNKFNLVDIGSGGKHTHFHQNGSSRIDRICVSLLLEKLLTKTKLSINIHLSDHLPISAGWINPTKVERRFILTKELIRRCDKEVSSAIENIENDNNVPKSFKILEVIKTVKEIYHKQKVIDMKETRKIKKKNLESIDASFNFIQKIICSEETNFLGEIERTKKKMILFHQENLWNNIALFDADKGLPNARTTNKIKPKYNKSIDELFTGNNDETTKDPKEMGNLFDEFYRNLYSLKEISHQSGEEIFNQANIPKQSNLLSSLNNEFSKKKISRTIKRLNSSSSPGSDGIGMSFYKKYYKVVSSMIAAYANMCVERGYFDEEVSNGLIKPIPKKDSDSRNLKNIRPITLLNSLYKIITGTVSFELGDLLPKIVCEAQKAVKGRLIHHNHFTLDRICKLSQWEKVDLAVTFVDTEKSFDLVSHKWIIKVIKVFGFPERFIKFVKATLKNKKSKVLLHNGGTSQGFLCLSGTPQGDPLSPLLYVLSNEPLLRAIINSNRISGISPPKIFGNLTSYNHNNEIFKLLEGCPITKALGYADDTTVFSKESEIPAVVEILNTFCSASGNKVNVSKTNILFLGSPPISVTQYAVVEKVNYLGIEFTKEGAISEQVDRIIEQMILLATIIKKMKSTSTLGKANLVKSYILSKLWYLAPIVTFTSSQIKNIENIIKWSLFSHKTVFSLQDKQFSKISLERLSQPKNFSIAHIPNIQARISSIKCKFLIELQDYIMSEEEPLEHLYWLEYSIFKDMHFNKRWCPLFSIRNISMETPKSNDSWIAQTHFAYQNIPSQNSLQPKVGDLVSVFYCNAIDPIQGKLISKNGKILTVQRSDTNNRKMKYDINRVFDANIISPHLFFKWDYSETRKISQVIYQNCKNRIFLNVKGKRRTFLENNKDLIITDDFLRKQEDFFYTEGQTKLFERHSINKKSLNISKYCRENIFSFHFKIFNNFLPLYNVERNCKLCNKHGLDPWHLFLECVVVNTIEVWMLNALGLQDHQVEKAIRLRKEVTREGAKEAELQNLMWTRNWSIWKLYNDFSHGRIKQWHKWEDIFLIKLAIEEFRTLNFAKLHSERLGKDLISKWNDWSLIYKFNFFPSIHIIPKNKQIIEKFAIF